MKAMSFILFSIFLLATTITGCKKEADPLTSEQIAGTYQLTSLSAQYPDGSKTDRYVNLDACTKASKHALNLTQVYQVTNSCDQTAQTGPWCLVTPEILILNRVVYDVLSYDGKNLVIIEDDDNVNGRLVKTFSRINTK